MCDEDGKPHKARRRLKQNPDGTVTDMDDGQQFKTKMTKSGARLVPHFKGSMDWKSAKGFAAMCLILSCLGADGEYVLWDEANGAPMTEEEWRRRKFGRRNKPPVRHSVCEDVVTSTCITNLQQGQGVGCSCNSNHTNHWRHRRPEVVVMGAERGFEVLTTEEEWADECDGNQYCPRFKCLECKEVVTSTCIANLQQGGSIGCSCNSAQANHWRHRRPEVVAMGAERGFEVLTTEDEWVHECDGNQYCPNFKCLECKEVVTSTCISSLQRGLRIGCSCNSNQANHWRHRRSEVVAMGAERGFEVLTTEDEWVHECDGNQYCPNFKCLECKEVVTSTCIANLHKGGSIGCSCNSAQANHWRHRRPEVVVMGAERGFEVLTTEEEWVDECDGCYYCPKFKCLECKEVVTSTCISSLQRGQRIGCSCHNKTEGKLLEWLQHIFPQARITRQYPGPKLKRETYFDFLLTFPDGFEVLVELDGMQHFWANHRFYTEEGCERDLAKEEWALAKGMSVVRVLQEDVWEDRYGWQDWLTKSIDKARTVDAKVFTPDTPEYRSTDSVYVQLRQGS